MAVSGVDGLEGPNLQGNQAYNSNGGINDKRGNYAEPELTTVWPENFRLTLRVRFAPSSPTQEPEIAKNNIFKPLLTGSGSSPGAGIFDGSPTAMSSSANPDLLTNDGEALEAYTVAAIAILAIILGLIILVTIIGNIFVIIAIIQDKELKKPQYFLVLSLAVADLLVGVAVMPLSAYNEIRRYDWGLSLSLCEFWISADVLCCTASILHLVAIALDRYFSITDVVYTQKRTPKRICLMILVVWIVSLVISVAPALGWTDVNFESRFQEKKLCLISQDVAYQIFSTTAAFWFPLICIIFLYYKIYVAAKRRIRKRTTNCKKHKAPKSSIFAQSVARIRSLILPGSSSESNGGQRTNEGTVDGTEVVELAPGTPDQDYDSVDFRDSATQSRDPSHYDLPKSDSKDSKITSMSKRLMRKQLSLESKRERKAFTTLAIVTGSFIVCWVPFFVLALIRPICKKCSWSIELDSFFLWLGYFNSSLNPIIYTLFSPDFRSAFRKIVTRGGRLGGR